MALRTTVSRIAARGTVITPPAETGAAEETEQPEVSAAETNTSALSGRNRYAGASRASAAVEETSEGPNLADRDFGSADPEAPAPSAATPPPVRRGRPPVDRAKTKKALQAVPIATGMESVPELRSKIKEVETLIKEARVRHDAEMKTLKTAYADLHAKMFDHVK